METRAREAAGRGQDEDRSSSMRSGRVLRLYGFRPLHVAFDRTMREVIVPDLARRPGVLDVCAARQGPEETGPRMVVSLWDSLAAMTEAMGPDLERLRFLPEYLADTTEHRLEVLPVLLALGRRGDLQTGILRIVRGELASMTVEDYARRVLAGNEVDTRRGHGPVSVALAATGERGFVTTSCWRDWATIETATGSTVERPMHTRHMADLSSCSVDHLELLPIGS